MITIGAGLAAGLALSVVANTVLTRWSIGNMSDPVVLLAISLVLLIVALTAGRRFLRTARHRSIRPMRCASTSNEGSHTSLRRCYSAV
jgi:hypothetical protein